MSCPHAAQVLASHLDGDVTLPFADGLLPHELSRHLVDCADCQRDLARARRLDAALAASAGARLGDDAGERLEALLQIAVARAQQEPPAPARRRRPLPFLPRLLAVAALVAAAFALLQPRPPAPFVAAPPRHIARAPTPPPAATPQRTPPPTASTTPTTWVSPSAAAPAPILRPARSRADVLALAALLNHAPVPKGSDAIHSRFAEAVELRLVAGSYLLDGGRADGCDAWIAAVAGLPAGPLLQGLLDDGRKRSALLQRLKAHLRAGVGDHTLDYMQRLCTAARLGDRHLDASLVGLLHRDPTLLDAVVAALRAPLSRPGRTELLMTVWSDLAVRELVPDDDVTAARLFAAQPLACTTELLQRFLRAGAPERRRCCLALGVLGDAQATDQLVQCLGAPWHDEAVAAAWALGRLSAPPSGDLLATAERDANAWLLRAGLTQQLLPVSKVWLAELDLNADERALLLTGPLRLEQFTTCARWFRERVRQGQ